MSAHVSPWTADRLYLGALSVEDKARVEQHLAECGQCRAMQAAAAEGRAHFAQYIAPKGVKARASWWTPVNRWWVGILATAVALLLVPRLLFRGDDIGIKGGPVFATYVRHAGQVAPLKDGATLHAGDQLRFVVVSTDLPYVMIGSIDGAGHPNIYYPFDGATSERVGLRTRLELPGSIVLDDAPGPERLFALFSKEPLVAADVARALAARGGARPATVLPVPAQQRTVLFEKSQ